MSESLTYRELQVLARIALGHENAQIAIDLGISIETARGHGKRMLRKLGARNRAEAVAVGYQRGLFDGYEHAVPDPVPVPAVPIVPRVDPAGQNPPRDEEGAAFRRALGEVLRERREQLRWTLDETAGPVGMSASVLSRLERDAQDGLDVGRVALLCGRLGFTPVGAVQEAQDRAFPRGWPHKVESP